MSRTNGFLLRAAGATFAASVLVLGMAGCNGCGSNSPAPITNAANGADPADANLATADDNQPTQVMGQSASYQPQQSGETYGPGQQAPAPIVNGNGSRNEAYNYNTQAQNTQANGYYDNSQSNYDQGYANGQADEYAQTDQAPPELPVYEQPPAPEPDDIWTPGYWGYANTGYYWNPGVWVAAPFVGALWTPGYWGWYGGRYRFHHGFWGRHIGYYGGINYGYGYIGSGYYGGYWNRDHFYYNHAVTRVSPRITNVYERNVVVNNVRYTAITNNRVSFNGGRGGVNYQPRPYEVVAMHEQHVGPLPAQQQFHREAAMNRANFYTDNHGRPAQLALAQPVRTERIAAPPEVNRGGFGRGPAQTVVGAPDAREHGAPAPNFGFHNGAPGNVADRTHNELAPQRIQVEQQRAAEQAQRSHLGQQEPQRGVMQPGQHPGQPFTPGNNHVQEQQRAAQAQQMQHNQAEQAQRGALQAQHTQQPMQENMQRLQQNRSVQPQQLRPVAEQPRPAEQSQQPRFQPQPQQHMEQRIQQQPQPQQHIQQQPQPQQRVEQQRPQFTAQPHFEQRQMQAPQPQQHTEAPRAMPAPTPRMEAPHAAPAPHFAGPPAGGGHPGGGGGEHPGGGGHH